MKLFIALIAALAIVSIVISACSLTGGVVIDPRDSCVPLEGTHKDECYFEKTMCSKISSKIVRESCVVDLAEAKGDLTVCNLISSERTKAYCQEKIAVQTKDLSICNAISDSYWKEICYFTIALDTNNSNACALVGHQDQQVECYTKIAVQRANPVLCNVLATLPEAQDNCFMAVAIDLLNPKVCNAISESLTNNACLLTVAKKANKEEYCDLIKVKEVRELCTNHFASSA